MFDPHPESDVCGVCYAAKIVREQGPGSMTKGFLWRVFDRNVPRREMEIILKNHGRGRTPNVPDYTEVIYDEVTLIRKVDIVLDLNSQWPALRLHEYKRGDVLQDESYNALRQLPDSELKMTFRRSAKDACVFLPCLGRVGDARPVGSLLNPGLMKSWIKECKANHNMCVQKHKASFPVGLMLIDTKGNNIMEVAPGTEPPYLALSYIWGGASQPELTKATKERRRAKGGLRDLCIPQTILDAIHLAKLMGYRYLWVDALCIVQDDSSIRHHQIAQMYNIYQNAVLTIVVASGSSCSQAIPGVSSNRRVFQGKTIHNISGLPLMKLPASIKYSVENSRWKTRGWTFQEELCSQRLLVLLPECAVFTCPSAFCREDLCFEVSPNSQDCQDFREGITLLSVTIRSLENASRDRQIALFQDLVKQYMHRSFSRNDDIENAFAGVSRMLEPVIGSSYHGIPGKYFTEIIHGCWFCDTTLIRREGGFPSWSWVGWIYRPQQADVGIKPMAGQNPVLQFYRLDADIQKLGGPSTPSNGPTDDALSNFNHFVPDEQQIRAKLTALQSNGNVPTYLIGFTTSCATLSLRGPFHHPNLTSPMIREYHVVHPDSGKHLTSIRLHSKFVTSTGKVQPFIIIAYDKAMDSFRLMLIAQKRANRNIVERVNVTMQSRLVRADDWVSLKPRKSTFIMA